MATQSELLQKWAPILEHSSLPAIKDQHRKDVTAVLLENQERAMMEDAGHNNIFEAAPANFGGSSIAQGSAGWAGGATTAAVQGYDPILISLVRRTMPQMIAYDICGVQPMTQPTGLIFAMKSRYSTQNGDEALVREANTAFSGAHTGAAENLFDGDAGLTAAGPQSDLNSSIFSATTGIAMTTADGEALGSSGGGTFQEMAFSIEKTSVTAQTRALKAEYTDELAQDLKSVHGLDAQAELSNILTQEILAEINREVVRRVYISAKIGAQTGTATAGTFDLDVDSNGRWSVEKFKGLMFQIEREANAIGQLTRRGKGNFIITSADVASALAMAGVLDYSSSLNNNLNVDDTSTTFAGILNGRFKVFVDPYAANSSASQFVVVGYKGPSAFDAGMFYCPYVPLQIVRATDPNTFQPKIGFKTRYGMVANPFAVSDYTGPQDATGLYLNSNSYFRKIAVANLM